MREGVGALDDDAVLVHIGMHKTGTTAVQGMLAAARVDLAASGVCYPGARTSHHVAARSLMGMTSVSRQAEGVPAHPREWMQLARQARRWPGRVVISSEYLSRAHPAQIRRLVDDLGAHRVHVLVGVRHLAPVLLASWQQDLKVRRVADLGTWLRRTVGDPDGAFWASQDPGATVVRWVGEVGPDNVTVLVIEEGDRTLLPETFEQLLDLPSGELTRRAVSSTNRGMSAAEAELVRQVNLAVRRRLTWPDYASLIRYGMIPRLVEGRSPSATELRRVLPSWALRRSAEEGERIARQITETGVRVVGDLSALTRPYANPEGTATPPKEVPIEAAVQAITGVLEAAQQRTAKRQRTPGESRWRHRMRTASFDDLPSPLRHAVDRLWAGRLSESTRNRVRAVRRRMTGASSSSRRS